MVLRDTKVSPYHRPIGFAFRRSDVITPLQRDTGGNARDIALVATDASGESHGMSSTTVRKILSAVSFARSDESLHSETNGSARCNRRSDPARKCSRSAGAWLSSNRDRFPQLRVAGTFRRR